MSARIFVDSNVLIYSRDSAAGEKQEKAIAWMLYLWKSRSGRLSIQVLNEFYFNVTQKLKPGLQRAEARDEVQDLLTWKPIPVDHKVLTLGWKFQDDYRFSFWDCLILAGAYLQQCDYLLSEDFSENQTLGDVQVLNPFKVKPSELV